MSTEEELIAMIRRGSEEAFTEAYRRYEPGLLRYLRGNCVGRRLAEEIIQETFVVLFQKRHALDGSKGSLGAYLFSIAGRKLLRAGRNDWRSEALASDHLERPSHDPAMSSLPDRLLLEKALNEIPIKLRVPLVLFEVNGFEYEEIATIIGKPVGTVKSRISRARRALFETVAGLMEREHEKV